jgi:hypothetical protein
MHGWQHSCTAGLASSSTGRNSRAEGPKIRRIWKGLRPGDRNCGPETGGISTNSPAKMHLPAPRGPLGGSWSKLARALPPAGRNLQGELASPVVQPVQSMPGGCTISAHCAVHLMSACTFMVLCSCKSLLASNSGQVQRCIAWLATQSLGLKWLMSLCCSGHWWIVHTILCGQRQRLLFHK